MKHVAALLAAACVFAAGPAAAVISNVTQASDVCAPTADPCVVADTVQVVSGSVLDFGTRALQIDPGGQIDIGNGSVTILCGDFTAATGTSPAILARGPNGFGGFDGGVLTLQARGQCVSLPGIACIGDLDCSVGACSAATGTVDIDGVLQGRGQMPADVSISAAGDIWLRRTINLRATVIDGDGGELWVESGTGSVHIEGGVDASGRSAGAGGNVTISSAGDTWVVSSIDVRGGDFGGGLIDIDAGRDVRVSSTLLAASTAGTGSGGDVTVIADRDVILEGGAEIDTDGHLSAAGVFAGDGGDQDLTAGGVLTAASTVVMHGDGGAPDGFGGRLSLASGGNLRFAGTLDARGGAGQGIGGSIDISAGGRLELAAGSRVDATGDAAGGAATIDGSAYSILGGTIDVSSPAGGSPGEVRVVAAGDGVVGGTISNGGAGAAGIGRIEIEACNLDVGAGGAIQNTATPGGACSLVSHEQLTVAAGGQVAAGADGNRFEYRSAAKAPVLDGTVTPAPSLVVNGLLLPCGTCGNGQVEPGEICDGGAPWQPGSPCNDTCTVLDCGDPDDSGARTATDALFVLRAAVGTAQCDPCLCNVDASSGANPVTATDALRLLRVAVGQPVVLTCPVCI